ncbi:MAG: DUF1015 domain-containing protein [Betaproteobacteria bacterium]|nr:DUF1015 domain-containing protein [Betaproteobacteria bacterium]
MPLIRPFAGLRPLPQYAQQVAAPPYDVLSSGEARARAAGHPNSFLHVSKAEIDLPLGSDSHGGAVYRKARENFDRLIGERILVRDEHPCFYVYGLTMGTYTQTGLVAVASVAAYDSGRIKRHELTRPDKEDDRVRHMEALNAQTGPVLVAYPSQPEIDALLVGASRSPPSTSAEGDDGVRHELWVIEDEATCQRLQAAFDALPALYIADGHHRSAAASRVAASRRESRATESHHYFLVVAFPHHETRILDYNRVVRDLNGMTAQAFVERVREKFDVHPSTQAVKPEARGEFGLYVAGHWYRLRVGSAYVPKDPVARLDVSILSDQILAPLLGIRDLRLDDRVDFVGGIRGVAELLRRVDSGTAAASFSLFPTSMEDLMAMADAGKIMPPKSTWFEPKLADGLVSHILD